MPFIVVALVTYSRVNYGLLESLPASATSASGARILEQHFPVDIIGPTVVLLENSKVDFSDEDEIAVVAEMSDKLMERHSELNVTDIRSAANPLGLRKTSLDPDEQKSSFAGLVEHKAERIRSVEHYVSKAGDLNGHVTELDIISQSNPFSMESVHNLSDHQDS